MKHPTKPKKSSNYERAEEWCRDVVKKGHDLLFNVEIFDAELAKASRDLGFPLESLNSFLRNIHLQYVKKRSYVIRNQMQSNIIEEYTGTIGAGGKSILQLAKKYNFPPSLLARAVIEHVTIYEKKKVTQALRDPLNKLSSAEVILEKHKLSESTSNKPKSMPIDPFTGNPMDMVDGLLASTPTSSSIGVGVPQITRLAREVIDATNSDPLYGPRFDRERQYVGVEYEILLERSLSSMNIAFETEEQLRVRGTPRTPDILFSCPMAIKVPKEILGKANGNANGSGNKNNSGNKAKHENVVAVDEDGGVWKMICWIDSKALFGDVTTHKTSVLPQAETYINRFGPGLILYWFGHAPLELLGMHHGGDVLVVGEVPKVFMLPTGDLAKDGQRIL